MNLMDLHIHSNASDGVYSPAEILKIALDKNLKGIALTDHDTVGGFLEAQSLRVPDHFHFLSGIEFSSEFEGEEVHILGYNFNAEDSSLGELLENIQKQREVRIFSMVEMLCDLKIPISVERVMGNESTDSIGRPHVARELVRLGVVKDTQEAFDRFLKKGKPAYVKRYKISIKEAVSVIKDLGGFAVMAHPGLSSKYALDYTLRQGIDGIEVYHPKHGLRTIKKLKNLATEKKWIITGGTDYHEPGNHHGEIEIGSVSVPYENIVDAL